MCAAAPARQLAKVTFDYDADNSDELTIKIGETVDIIDKQPDGQEGWWEVCDGQGRVMEVWGVCDGEGREFVMVRVGGM